ncbi:extracellular solute-binding protein [Paenibacillus campinasensis]|uniref:Extracellular solute-binding protein n=1 Tax=Paenibacillus campinasensis TaxID=66347 RepID=A0ABW9SZP3_9BACL|nr:ABC transporter substrate-binding protein [Paenibacillus campinasensis]MUG66257.1 extracellular solute-binding protein [Paenibacillus campinasensis]
MARDRLGWASRWAKAAAVLLLAGALAGCTGESEEQPAPQPRREAVRLDYWTPFSGGDNQFMTEMVERFNKEQSEIMVVQTNSRLDDYYTRLRTAILSGNAPDIAIIHTTSMPQFVQNGYIEEVTAAAEQIGLDLNQLNSNIRESTEYNGQSYAVPLDTHALVMYYNKQHLRRAGVLDEATGKPRIEPGEEGFRQFLEQIREAVPADVTPMAMPSTRIDSVWLWWSLYNQMDEGGIFYNEQGEAAFNNPQGLQALSYIHGLYKDGLIGPNINDSFKLFYDGKAAVLFLGMWGTGAFEKSPEVELGVVTVPVLYDRPAQWGDSHSLAIPKKHNMTDEKRRAAMIFSKWMVENGELWAQAGHVPSMTKVVESEAFHQLEYRNDYAAAADHVVYWPRHPKQWSMIEILITEFERMIYDKQTPEETLMQAQLKVDVALEE